MFLCRQSVTAVCCCGIDGLLNNSDAAGSVVNGKVTKSNVIIYFYDNECWRLYMCRMSVLFGE